MTRLLDLLAVVAVRFPRATIGGLLLVTVGLGAAASGLEVDTGFESFAPQDGVAATLDDVEDRFGTVSSVQLLVDAGAQGTVLDEAGLAAAERLERALTADPVVAAALAEDRSGQPAVVDYGFPFRTALEVSDQDLDDLPPPMLALLVDGVLDEAGDQVSLLLSEDLEQDPPRARAGLVQISLDTSVDAETRGDAARAVEAVAAEAATPGLRVSVVSMTAIEDGIERALARDMPILLGTSLLLVLGVLAWLFRSVSDVVVGFVGLLASIVWMAGAGALLGPDGLGLIGPMSQIAIAVPVLLVGLGIDYSVHLTTRYREQQARGDQPERAARTALRTVGVALVLATVASVAGFLANLATPLPPIRDFGVLAAVGIVSAFLLLGALVPATRTLLDRRREDAAAAATDGADATSGDPWWVRLTTTLATRHIGAVLGVTTVLLVAGATAASQLSTEFNDRDFLPDGDPVVAVIDRLEAQFGGDIGERTYVLVDGDPTDPALLTAVDRFEAGLPAVDDVRTVGDAAEVTSPLRLVDQLGEQAAMLRDRIAGELDDWRDPAAAAARIDLPDDLDPALLADQADGDLTAGVPDELLAALRPRLPEGRDPGVALAATADPDELTAQVRSALADDLAAERPASLGDAELDELAALSTDALTLDRLRAAGYPLDRLDEDERRQLELLEDLEAAGWRPERGEDAGDDGADDGAALREQLTVVAEHEPEELARLADDDGMLVIVGTQGGQDTAETLVSALTDAAAPVVDAGGAVTVVSEPLMEAEIISSLSAAQLLAILISLVAAAVLLVTATLIAVRSVALGLIGIVPSVVALVLVLGAMYPLGLAFNALTATVASIAVGIGVPYGIHLINRFREARQAGLHADDAVADSLRHTGAALVGSAVTTGLAFAVLLLSASTPIRQFGAVSTLMIGFALLACLLVQPALLVLWARRHEPSDPAPPAREVELVGTGP